MAPSRRKTTRTTTTANPERRIITRSIYKKQNQQKTLKIQSLDPSNNKEMMSCREDDDYSTNYSHGICSTPKGDKYMIPKISTCPPAPKKKRLVLNCLSSSPTTASPSKFFAHSDLEVFFLFAPRDIHA